MKHSLYIYLLLSFILLAANVSASHLQRNDRGVESTRDYTNMMQQGLMKGMLKETGSPGDCVAEGMTIFRSIAALINKWVDPAHANEQMIGTQLFENYMIFLNKCNLFDTIEGIALLRMW